MKAFSKPIKRGTVRAIMLVLILLAGSLEAQKTQTAQSAKKGAIWGGLAGLVFGGSLGDVVAGAAVGGAGGAAFGHVKERERQKRYELDIQDQALRLEQERNYILQDEIAEAKASQGHYTPEADRELLVRAFGEDNVRSLTALRDCDHKRAQLYAMAGANTDRARMETLDALTDVIADRRNMGISCST